MRIHSLRFVLDLGILLTFVGMWYGDRLLKELLEGELNRLESRAGIRIEFQDLILSRPNLIQARTALVNHSSVSLRITGLSVDFSWLNLVLGQLKPRSVRMDTCRVNWQSFQHEVDSSTATPYACAERLQKLNTQLSWLLHLLPNSLSWNAIQVYRLDSLLIQAKRCDLVNRSGVMELWSNSKGVRIQLTWSTNHCWIKAEALASSFSVPIPIGRLVKQFDTLSLKVELVDRNALGVMVKSDGLVIQHKSIHTAPVLLPSFTAESNLVYDLNGHVEMSSQWEINRLKIKLNGQLIERDSTVPKQARLLLSIPEQLTSTWQAALPPGVFRCLPSLGLKGKLGLEFVADYNSNRTTPLVLDCKLPSTNLRLESDGLCQLGKLAGAFTYRPWGSVRQIKLGTPGIEGYTPLEQISPLLRASVLNAEDGGFFWHRGFNAEALAESTIENLKRGYFRRGGSTLTMQLVKNVYLGREKTLFRKLEELAIVWLIEHFRLSTKDRMFEQYLNLIEWGPEIYGIREAADFYFRTSPAQLTPLQSIFLASIIPSPRSFRYRFESQSDTLRSFNAGFFQLIGRKLVQQKHLTEDELKELDYRQLRLKGRALQWIQKKDVTQDSLPPPNIDWIQSLLMPQAADTVINVQKP
jgi:hypothetical protein